MNSRNIIFYILTGIIIYIKIKNLILYSSIKNTFLKNYYFNFLISSYNISDDTAFLLKKNQNKKAKIYFGNIKINYFMQNIFDMKKKSKSLEIIKYYEKLQKRFNLSINHYIIYSKIYSSI